MPVRPSTNPNEKVIGKTIEAVQENTVTGCYGNEQKIDILFSDGTKHSFVLPLEE